MSKGRGILCLVKASNDVISHCSCEHAPISTPPQMDCPWCGCGWLFTCIDFTFARAVHLPLTHRDLAVRELRNYHRSTKTGTEFEEWLQSKQEWVQSNVEWFEYVSTCIQLGEEYVVLDGRLIATKETGPWRYDGWHASHELFEIPQVAALAGMQALDQVSDPAYWHERRLPDKNAGLEA